jgi:uncharacterized protein
VDNKKTIALFLLIYHFHQNRLFPDYINFGGYPEPIFSETVRQIPERFIRQDIIDKVLMRDLPGISGISGWQELNSLFSTIAFNTGQISPLIPSD